ncbi:hypothetical protein FYJ85_11090 [Victivallaceae bacterium BBE-744-WT-12]|uniref:Uncharacterized protein n=1 Tax=Victivallis lenta TaxID=2606640 RepID=A0A844G3N7_9BACT|nr:hypothetical protein [Victivallis lenta]MST97584.1 hypothetical protein [Victivallis lenta]
MNKKQRQPAREKTVKISVNVHRELKIRAVRDNRNIHLDLTDDIIMLGIEEYDRSRKNLPSM